MPVSRRGFLATSAAAAAAPRLLKAGGVPDTGPDPTGALKRRLVLRVNGADHEVEVENRSTLLDVLRWQLGLTGPKEVCDRGSCGACTVLVDDRPRLACMTLAVDMSGHEITTVEGLGTAERPNRVQEAMIRHDAVQCGYCIPGFVMSMEGALRRDPRATPEDLRAAVAGNLCRCGTYNKVFEAAERICGGDPEAGRTANAPACLENEHSRVDAAAKITGAAVYGADLRRPGMLFAQHVLCPYGRATLVSADDEAVRRLPDVVEVEITTGKEYRYSGAPVGYICAATREALRDALSVLRLEWEPAPVETDPVVLHEDQAGPFPPPEAELASGRRGEAARAALEEAALVLERVYTTQIQVHSTLEPHGGTVDPTVDPPEGWFSTQGTFTCVSALAEGLGKSADEVAVRCEYIGGGFGSKFGAGREGALAARLASRHGRPVRVFNGREAEQLDTGNRPGSMQWMKIGAAEDGKLLGGYIYTAGTVGVGGGGGVRNPARYDFGAIGRKHVDVKGPHGAPRPFRAPGHPQGMFAVESMMDELAEALGVDPLDIRLRNETSEVRKDMLRAGAADFGWPARLPSGSQRGRLRRGMGIGVGDWGNGKGRCDMRMRARPDGLVEVYSGTQDIGTGQRTLIVELTADALGIPRDLVRVHVGNSQYPYGPASGGSTTARLTAPAVRDTAAKLRERLGLAGGEPIGAAAWHEACGRLAGDGVAVQGAFNDEYWGRGGSEAVQFAEVEVDTETGVVRVQRVLAIQACGLAVNRLTAENQVLGGVLQGISYALFEERATDPQLGYQLNADLEHYKILGALDVPEIVPRLWGHKDGLGVRGLGEPPTVPTAGAIANAVANALGARVRSLPITPDRVLAALEDRA